MDVEGQLRRLRKTVEEQGTEVARLTSELGQQSRLMKLFDETLQQTAQTSFTLEHRLSNLEHERETGSRSTRNAFESLGARVTELGVEVAELPTLKEMQATWQQLAQSVESCEKLLRAEHQEALGCLNSRMEAALGNLQKDASLCFENLSHCRQDVTSLQRQIWEESEVPAASATPPMEPGDRAWPTQAPPSEPVTAMPFSVSAASPLPEPSRATLVKRLRVAEDRLSGLDGRSKVEREDLLQKIDLKANQKDFEDLQKVVAGKSDKGHSHDCLVSADGSVTFSL